MLQSCMFYINLVMLQEIVSLKKPSSQPKNAHVITLTPLS